MPETKTNNPWVLITIIVGAIALLFFGTSYYLKNYVKSGKLNDIFKPNTTNSQEKQVLSKLSGQKAGESTANRHPLAVVIENHPDARPQYGLNKATLVYEAIAEGGITRFLAIYGPNNATKIGPIRSARTYFVDWTSEYNAYLAHVGGNLDALDMIKANNILDLDQFGLGETTYWREARNGVALEHTMYSNTDSLYKAAQAKNWPQTTKYQTLSFKKDEPTPSSNQQIEIDFSTASYKVDWQYDAQTNTYLRSLAGQPHLDGATGDRLVANNVIIQEVDRWEAKTTINEEGYAMKTTGTGKAKIFIDGKETDGTWKKTSRTDRTIFYNESGREIEFNPGNFWIEITPPEVFAKIKVN
ncbi:MAG: DUF3048 domain-containing protein [Candidatus Berkelbacteria bacterium]